MEHVKIVCGKLVRYAPPPFPAVEFDLTLLTGETLGLTFDYEGDGAFFTDPHGRRLLGFGDTTKAHGVTTVVVGEITKEAAEYDEAFMRGYEGKRKPKVTTLRYELGFADGRRKRAERIKAERESFA